MKIKLYDIEKFVKDQSAGEYEVHRDKKIAIFLNSEYKGLYMSFDCVGYEINGENDTIEIATNSVADMKPNTIRIINSHCMNVPLKEFLEKCTFEVVDEKDYFSVFSYHSTKDRVRANYREMIAELKELGIKGEDA